jgi:hypothetical protein
MTDDITTPPVSLMIEYSILYIFHFSKETVMASHTRSGHEGSRTDLAAS